MPSAAAPTEISTFRKAIQQLPDIDSPFLFQLPDNIERSLQRATSAMLIRQLNLLAAADAVAQRFDREKWKAQLQPLLDQWTQLTGSSPGIVTRGPVVSVGGKGKKAGNGGDPVEDFVQMEHELAGEICTAVDAALTALKKVLHGTGLLTPAIQTAAQALLAGTVPNDWIGLWDSGPEKPQVWLRELVRKRLALSGKWRSTMAKGGSNALLSQPLPLADLFHPATFLNALRQHTARALKNTAIDQVALACAWDQEGREARRLREMCPLVAVLSGLRLQGAAFHFALQEAQSEAAELLTAPEVMVGFVPLGQEQLYESKASVGVPLYLSTSRELLLAELTMPLASDRNAKDPFTEDRAILAGVALFLSEDE